ncbi:immunoglobulin-like domain-containing protein [Marinobacter sp. 1_MG-2023]|uniref:immunoglobulin-like domain-containing protein n=1 Tax=Marinobacter sp. 1_MG-2023 TaxID=3062627 RepID=UPI0026E13A5D|nr:immunoglobulin-like domain-containing protein [Marinobacter sp. 1_MG-2023]MDO6823559.1 DUF5801 repeats-in-toxin domain-containing protein [Marinobacter sp. 1_MG-2023]
MTTLAIVVSLIGQAWAENANGERRLLSVGDQLGVDETLIMEEGARVDLDFGDNQQLTFVGEQQVSADQRGEFMEQNEDVRPQPSSDQAPADASPTLYQSATPEGHGFVQLVRIGEIIEADGYTPVTVARIQEVLRPFGMSLPQSTFVRVEIRDHQGSTDRHETNNDYPQTGSKLPKLSISIDVIAGNDIVDATEAGQSITLTGTVGGGVEPGDRVTVTVNGQLYETTVNADGKTWQVDVPGSELAQDNNVQATIASVEPNGTPVSEQAERPYEVDSVAPTVTVELEPGSGTNGGYNEDDTKDGKVTGKVTFDPDTTEPGDTVIITDKDGEVIIERPVTEDDITNGIIVDVPVSEGQTDVELNVTITDPVGNTGTGSDAKPVDNVTPGVDAVLEPGSGPNGDYNEADTQDGKVTGTITFDPNTTLPGDKVTVTDIDGNPITDKNGDPIVDYELTEDDIDNGIVVDVPVAEGQIDVELNVEVSDPAGNTSTGFDKNPKDNIAPEVIVELEDGSGPNGAYNEDDTSDGKVTGTITFKPGTTEPGDTVKITDKDGNVIIERPVTEDEINNGITVDVPVSDGQTSVDLNVEVVDPAGNTGNGSDTKPVDNITPTLEVELEPGSGPNGSYNEADTSDGTVEGTITLDPGTTKPGDTVVITDGQGNELINRPVTQDDIDNGISVDVPVTSGRTEVELNATVTDPAGNTSGGKDENDVDNVGPGASVELAPGTGPGGSYNEGDITDGTVTGKITLTPETVPGDTLVVTDGNGNELINRPVTQDDIDNGVSVEVPVEPGQPDVEINVELTDPSGNTGTATDNKDVDNVTPTVEVELATGSSPDGSYNKDDADNGTVEGTINLDPTVSVGDHLVVTDGKGNTLFDAPVTQADIDNGVIVQVPITDTDTQLELNAEITDEAGNTSNASDDKPVDAVTPTLTAELEGAGSDGVYSVDEITDGKVTGKVTLDPNTVEVGDRLVIQDGSGSVLIDRPVTQDDINDGVSVDISVSSGATEVEISATITDPSGNTSDDADNKTVDNVTPTVEVELEQGSGPNGSYNEDDTSDGTVEGTVTLDPGTTKPGDTVVITDAQGNELINRPITQDDIDNGITVDVPVTSGQTDVELNATVTDPAGNTSSATDSKLVDNLAPDINTPIADQSDLDADVINLDVSGNFNDIVDGSDISYSANGLPDGLTIDPDTGVISGTIDKSASQFGGNGEHTVTISVTDQSGNSADTEFAWSVSNPLPDAVDDAITAVEGITLTVDSANGVLANDSDPDGDNPLGVTEFAVDGQTYSAGDAATIAGVGELTLNADGSYEFVPEPDYSGTVPAVTYTVSDADGGTSTADLHITVEPVLDITLSAPAQVNEGDKITVTATVETPVQDNPLYVILDNGQTITIPVGQTSGSAEVDSRLDDAYTQGSTTAEFEVVGASGGSGHINDSSFGSTTSTEVVDNGDATTVSVSTADVTEDATGVTFNFQLSNPPQTGETVTLTVDVAGTEHTVVVDANGGGDLFINTQNPDVYLDPDSVTAEVTAINGGNFEATDLSGATATAQIADTIDAVTAELSVDSTTVNEGGSDLAYTVTLMDANGNAVDAKNDITVTLSDGSSITIAAGSSSESFNLAMQSDDVYVDGETISTAITDISEQNAGAADSFEDLTFNGAAVNTVVSDTIDTTSVSLTAGPGLTESGGTLTYTVTLGGEVRAGDDPVEVTFKDLNGDDQIITIGGGNTTGTVDVIIPPSLFEGVYKDDPQDIVVATDVAVSGGSDFENLGAPSVGTVEITDSIDITTATLTSSGSGDEDNGSITYTINLDNAPQADQSFSITLSNGQTASIQIAAGATSGEVAFGWGTGAVAGTQALDGYPDGDVYVEDDVALTVDDFAAVGNGGNFEQLDLVNDSTGITIADTDTPVTITLSDITSEEGESQTITATVDHPVTENDLVISLSNGETITIAVGATSGTSDPFQVQSDDVYVDGETYDLSIDSVTGGNFEQVVDTDTSTVTVTDTIDPVYAQITVDQDSVLEGGTLNYTVNLVDENGDPVNVESGKDVTVNLDWSGAAANTGDVDALPASITITGGNASASFEVNTTADMTAELSEPVAATIESVVDNAGIDPGFENLQVDSGNDSATAHIVDAPTIEVLDDNGAADGQLTVHEQGLNTGDGSNTVSGVLRVTAPSGLDSIEIGGQEFTLADIEALDGTQTITVSGHGVITLNSSAMVETANGQPAVWEVDFDYKLTDAQAHSAQGADDALKDIDLTVTATDPQDAANSVIGSGSLGVLVIDDLPEVDLTGVELDEAQVKEAQIGAQGAEATVNFSGAFDIKYGVDGNNGVAYELVIDNSASGLVDTASGDAVMLFDNSGVIEGRNDNGDVVFTITVDAATGQVTLVQNRALEHEDPLTPNDFVKITNGAIDLKATAKDGDGDEISNTVNIGDRFVFQDDGPAVSGQPTATNVDEKYLDSGSEAGQGSTSVTASLPIDTGEDGMGSLTFATNQTALQSLLASTGNSGITIDVTDETLTGTRGGEEVFVVTLDKNTGKYTFELKGALAHPVSVNGTMAMEFAYQVQDADDDSATGTFVVNLVDDVPKTSVSITTDEDTAYGPFTTSADSTQSNVSIQDTDDNPATSVTILPDGSAIPTSTLGYDVGHGVVVVDTDGKLTFYPDADYSNEGSMDNFQVTITNDDGSTTVTEVDVTVNPVSDAPGLEDDKSISTPEDTAVALGLTAPVIVDDTDQNGDGTEGDNPERLGAITLTLDDDAPTGTVLTKSDGASLTADAEGGYTVVIVENSGDTVADTDLHLSEGLPTANVNYLTKDEYEALKIEPAEDRHENVEVTVSVTSYEVDSDGKKLGGVDGAHSQQSISVDVQAVTDAPEITLAAPAPSTIGADSLSVTQPSGGTNGKIAVSMSEDTTLDLQSVLIESLADTDGSESYWYSISGLPEGTKVSIGGNDYTADASGNISIPEGEYLSGDNGADPSFSITPPKDYSSDEVISATIALNTLDSDSDSIGVNPDTESVSIDLELTVTPVAGDVTAGDVETEEDTAVNFLENVRVTDTGTGTEVINSVSFEIPENWVVTAPVSSSGWSVSGDGSAGNPYTITFNDDGAGGVTVLDEAAREAVLDGFTITPPAHSSADAEINLNITTTDTQTVNGTEVSDTKTVEQDVKVTVTPQGEIIGSDSDSNSTNDLTMVGDHDYSSAGEEDSWFTLGTEAGFNLQGDWNNEDSDDSEETFALLTPELVEGDGSQADANGSQFRYNDGSGLVTQTYGGEAIEVPVEYLDTLEFLAPPDFAGMFEIKVEALTRDTDPDDGSVSEKISGESTLTNILIKPSADTPTTTVTARVNGNEDESVPLSIRPSSSDLSETFNVTINAIPDGAEIVYDGQILSSGATGLPAGMTITDNGNDTWKVEIEGFDPDKGGNMTLTPPEHSNKPFTLEVATVSVDTLEVNGTEHSHESTPPFELSINVTPKGVADSADVAVKAVEDQSFTEADVDSNGGVMLEDLLVYTPSLTDTDGSETLSFKLSNLPAGFGVEGATSLGNGEWVFAASELGNVKITTPTNFSGTSAEFTLAAVTTENDGDSLTAEHKVQVRITPSPEATMNLSTGGVEDTPAKLDFSAQQQNGETDETITEVWIKASDLAGKNFTLTYGENGSALGAEAQTGVTVDGDWYKLDSTAMDNIYLNGDDNWHGNGSFTVQYRVGDPGDDGTVSAVSEMSGDQTYNVSVAAVTDQPELTVPAGSNIDLDYPGTATIDLNIANQGSDFDGSEQLTRILLDNVPEGVIVEGADFIGGNQWLFITSDSFDSALTPLISLKVQSEAGGLTDHEISITVTTEDASNGQLKTDSTTVSLTTNFPAGDESQEPAEIVAWEQSEFDPTEDTAFTLNEAFNGEIEDGVTDNGFNITLSNLPVGTVVTGMTSTVIGGETVWTASGTGGNSELQTLMDSITVTPPADWNSNKGNFDFDAKLTTYVPSGLRDDETVNASFDGVQPVSDEPEITISAPAVDEGNDLVFTVDLSNTADDPNWTLVDGKLYLQLDESGIDGSGVLKQGGAALNATSVSGGNGLPGGDYYVIDSVDLSSPVQLTYTPSTDYVNGSVSLSAWAQSQEDDSTDIVTGEVTQTGVIKPVNSGYDFTVENISGAENASQLAEDDKPNVIQIPVTDNGLSDSDGSEAPGAVLLSNVPNGFLVYVGDSAANATAAELSNNAGGGGTTNTWLLGNGEIPNYIGIMPPQYWSGTVNGLTLQVTSGEEILSAEEVSTQTFNLTVEAQADGLTLAPTPSFGEEGDIIPLNLNHELKDPVSAGASDASTETLTLELSGMGEHAALYLGDTLISGTSQVTDHGAGSYTVSGLTSEEAETLGFVQAANELNSVQVRAQTVESGNGNASAWTEWEDIDTSGVTQQYGTTGDDSLLWTGEAIDAFGGEDTIQLRFGESLTSTDLANNLKDIETIDMQGSGDNKIEGLSVEDVISMTDEDNLLTISGDADDSISLDAASGWELQTGAGVAGYDVYTASNGGNDATLHIQQDGVIVD